MQDELLRLTGSTNDPWETVTANGNGTGKYVGADRLVVAKLMIDTVSGTSPTLDVKFQDSADNSSYADMGIAFTQVTASLKAAHGGESAPQRRSVRTVTGRPYVRIVKTVGGTSPSFETAVLLEPQTAPLGVGVMAS